MPEFRLDSFETDDSNKFALALLGAVLQLEKGYSPLFLHGEQGSGKTHLLSALTTELSLTHPEISLLYIPDDFPIESLLLNAKGRDDGANEFIYEAYSRKDFLIVDDIERFGADSNIRDRFYSLFDAFVDNAKQVVIASSSAIEELQGFDERFQSRLRGGVDALLSPPEPEGRLKILKRECKRLELDLDLKILQLLMNEAGNDIQYLLKLPAHIKTFATLNRQSLTEKKVEEFLKVIRTEAGEEKGAASTEQVYGSWLQVQAKKREEKLTERIRELEARLSEQVQKTNELDADLETTRSLQQTSAQEGSDLATQIKQLKKELKEKDKRLDSQESLLSKEISRLNKGVEKRDELIEKLKADYEKELTEKDSRLSEMENTLGKTSKNLTSNEELQKQADATISELNAELEKLKKSSEDETLSLKIQLEDKEENLKLLSEEREMRAGQYEKEKVGLEEKAGELQSQNLFLERTIEDLNDRIRELENHLEQKSAELAGAAEVQNAGAQEHEVLRRQIEELRSKLTAESDHHAAEIKQKTELERELRDSLEAKQKEFNSLNAQAEEQRAQLQAGLESAEAKLEETARTAGGTEAELASERERIQNLESELASRESSFEEFKTSKETIISELQQTVSEREEALAAASELEAKLRGELEGLTGQLDSERSQTQTNEQRSKELSDQLARLEEDLASAKTELRKTESTVAERSEKLAEAESRASELTRELDEFRASSESKIEENAKRASELEQTLSQTKASFEQQAKQAETQIEELKQANSQLEGQINEQNEKLAAKEKESAERSSELDGELKRRDAELQELKKENAAQTREVESKSNTEAKLNEKISTLDAELKAASEQIRELKADAKAAEKKLKKQERMLKSAETEEERAKAAKLAKEKDRHIADLQRTVESLRKELPKKAGAGAGADKKFSPLEAELSDKERILAAVRLDFAELQANYDDLRKRTAETDEKLEKLESERAEKEQEIESQKEKVKRLEADLPAGQSEESGPMREELLSQIAELEKAVEEADKAKAEAETRSEEVAKLKSEHEKTTESLKQQVKDAMKEMSRIREAADEEVRKHSKEVETLQEKLDRVDSKMEPAEAGPQPVVEDVAPVEGRDKVEAEEPDIDEDLLGLEENPEVSAEIRAQSSQIEWKGDFESFQIVEANAFSVSMAEKIARNPGELYNPLCIYGPPGSGKTHILHAIGDLSTSEDPELTCALISIESLLEVIQAEKETVGSWLATVRLLIIDDFQIAEVTPELQLKLYEFFKSLADRDAQIALASEEPPIRMNYLQEYFLRFLEGGLLAKLDPHPDILAEQEAAASAASAEMASSAESEAETDSVPDGETAAESEAAEPKPPTEPQKDFFDEFLAADSSLTDSNFRGKRAFEEFEEAFRYPNKKWRNKFPLLVIEDDSDRRKHFFHALANRLGGIFSEPVSLLSMEELAELLALTPSFDWNGLLNKLGQSAVVLINGCECINRMPDSATEYLQAIIKDISKHDILLMIGMSKQYTKEPTFGTVFKKASRKKI